MSRPSVSRLGIFDNGGRATGPRIALDLLGGDRTPEAVVEGALMAVRRRPDMRVALVGPPESAAGLLGECGQAADGNWDPGSLAVVPARDSVSITEEPT
ncbi:MAG: hypothetical protein ACXV3F_14820, partial [Frankiaceae bacterium]